VALTITSGTKDEISLLVVGKAFAQGTANQQLGIDKAADRALAVIDEQGRSFGIIDADSPPAEWARWLVRLGAYEASAQFMPEREANFRAAADIAEDDALSTFSKFSADSTDASPIEFTAQSIRRYVMENCMNMRPRVKPSVAIIDQELQNTIMSVWNDADWSFRRKRVTLSISVTGAVTTAPAVIIASIPDNKLKYTVTSTSSLVGDNTGYCHHVSDQQMNEYGARTLADGRPEAFRMLTVGNVVAFTFSRMPDQIYTAEAEVIIRTPDISSITTIDSSISLFPIEFQHVLKSRTLAGVLNNMGKAAKAQPILSIAENIIAGLLPIYSDPGGDPANDSMYPARINGLGPAPWGGVIGGSL